MPTHKMDVFSLGVVLYQCLMVRCRLINDPHSSAHWARSSFFVPYLLTVLMSALASLAGWAAISAGTLAGPTAFGTFKYELRLHDNIINAKHPSRIAWTSFLTL